MDHSGKISHCLRFHNLSLLTIIILPKAYQTHTPTCTALAIECQKRKILHVHVFIPLSPLNFHTFRTHRGNQIRLHNELVFFRTDLHSVYLTRGRSLYSYIIRYIGRSDADLGPLPVVVPYNCGLNTLFVTGKRYSFRRFFSCYTVLIGYRPQIESPDGWTSGDNPLSLSTMPPDR